MWKAVARTFAVLIGVFSVLVVAFFFLLPWGQWRCGLNSFQITFANMLGAASLSVAIILWCGSARDDRVFRQRALLIPWVILGTLTIFVFTLAPDCPFPSR